MKSELDDELAKLSTKLDQAASKSVSLKEQVKESQAELAALAKEQAELDQVRSEQHADFVVVKKEWRHSVSITARVTQVLCRMIPASQPSCSNLLLRRSTRSPPALAMASLASSK